MSKFLSLIKNHTPKQFTVSEGLKDDILYGLDGSKEEFVKNMDSSGKILSDTLGLDLDKEDNEDENDMGTVLDEIAADFADDMTKTELEAKHGVENVAKFISYGDEDNRGREVDPEEVPAEDFESLTNFMDKGRQKKADRFDRNKGNITGTLNTAHEYIAADPDPARPSRGVKKVQKSISDAGEAIAKQVKNATKMIR